eukprot:gene9944-2265_t
MSFIEQLKPTLKKLFDVHDLNGDGVISVEEFSSLFEKMNPDAPGAVKQDAFKQMDTDGNGTVTVEDTYLFFENIGKTVPNEQVDSAVAHFKQMLEPQIQALEQAKKQ